jgi:hypothetical protein
MAWKPRISNPFYFGARFKKFCNFSCIFGTYLHPNMQGFESSYTEPGLMESHNASCISNNCGSEDLLINISFRYAFNLYRYFG